MTITRAARAMWTAAVVWAAVGCVAAIGLAQQAPTPDRAKAKVTPAVLLEKGIYTEETVGDLDAAIKVYQQIVDDAKANRQYIAKAHYRLGMCQLKKGNKAKARQVFRDLLATYPQEKLIAAKARGQLAKLAPALIPHPKPSSLGFDPVIERTLSPGDRQKGRLLDLDTGKMFDLPSPKEVKPIHAGGNLEELQDWTARRGIDLMAQDILLGFELAVFPQPNTRWDELPTANLLKVMGQAKGTTPALLAPGKELPATFYFKTREGRLGVLQIVGFKGKKKPGDPRGIKIRYKLLKYGDASIAETPTDATPSLHVVRTNPVAFTNDVDPSLDKITVTFNRPMIDKSWSWTGGGETFPKIQTPSYDAARTTCTLPVKLQPGKVYWVGINSPSYRNFKSADGTPAPWYVILFATKSAEGKPTPLPDDLAKRARAINETSARAAVPRLPKEVMGYIISKHYEAARSAQEKRLRVNTHIYGVDERFALYSGGLLGYVNSSDKPQGGPIHLGNFGRERPNHTLMDETGRPQQFELRERPDATFGKYGLWWKPDQPIQPGASRLLGYINKNVRMLPMAPRPGQTMLTMQNTFGSPVLENFFLVVPRGMIILRPSRPQTSKATVGQFDIYLWQKQVPLNTRHFVTMGLKAPDAGKEALKGKLINWVEDFFSKNSPDITARKTIEWGDPETTPAGNLSIRYKYIATVWNKNKKIIEQRFTFTPEGKYISAATIEKRPAPLPEAVSRVQKVIVEDLATQMLVAIRDKDDAALKAMATDSFKGWTKALPKFALEAREKFLQKTKKPFQMFAGESVVLGDVAAVKCTGPKELNGTYLALFFVKTEDGWKNFRLRNSPPTIPLETHLRRGATEIGVQLQAAVDEAGKKAAVSEAEQWLKLVDDGKYGASWDAASSLLCKAVAKEAFAKQIQAARKPLGKVKSRKIISAKFEASMPGAPDGQYVVVQFQAAFENKKQAVETITPMKCEDGKWRVSGYYIK